MKADLHVHSYFSAHPSEWFLQRLGTRESYTDPETIYQQARGCGMSFVTITDHNEIAGSVLLHEKYPEHTFTGVETTTYFPENNCKVHLLIYGLTASQFDMVQRTRSDIYQLRAYIKEQDLAHAVAHATYAVNKKLTLEHIERLFLLFDYFEAINGSRSRIANEVLADALSALSPEKMDDLRCKYRIEPYSETPWIKGLTAGTDDHSGLFIGKTFTQASGRTPAAFLERIKAKQSSPGGRHNDYQGLAFAIYKIAYDFSHSKNTALSSSLFSAINRLVFEDRSISLKNRLAVKKIRLSRDRKEDAVKSLIVELIDMFSKCKGLAIERRLGMVYDKITEIADHLFRIFATGIERDVSEGDMTALIKRISGMIPGIFFAVPFFTTLNLLHESRNLLNELAEGYAGRRQRRKQRVLLFADMCTGAPIEQFMHPIASSSYGTEHEAVVIVGCTPEHASQGQNRRPWINLPPAHSCAHPLIQGSRMHFPSILGSLKLICETDPDRIIVATPGPVGFMGLLASRLMHVQSTSLYQAEIADSIFGTVQDDSLKSFIADFTRWFYSFADCIAVLSPDEVHCLTAQGYDRSKIIIYPAAQHKPAYARARAIKSLKRISDFSQGPCAAAS